MQLLVTRNRSRTFAIGAVLAVGLAVAACSADPAPEGVPAAQITPGSAGPGTSAPGTTAGPPRSGTTQTTLPRPSTTSNAPAPPTTRTTPTSFTPGPIEPQPEDTVPDGVEEPTLPTDDPSSTTTEPDPEVLPSDFDLPFPTTSEP